MSYMSKQELLRRERWIIDHFETEESLEVTLVEDGWEVDPVTFYTPEDAIRDIPNLEMTYDVYF
jgi:hypothetical protein